MIEIRDLVFAYRGGDFSLHVDRLEIGAGERVAITGPSGSGKTTMLNLLAGIMLPDRGDITIADKRIAGLGEADRRALRAKLIGFIFQDFALLDYLNVFDNIIHPLRIVPSIGHGTELKQRARELAERVELGDKLHRPIKQLSQGERQRVAICRALLTRPKLILADEATGNLDPNNKSRILELLFRQAEAEAAAIVAVTHDHDLLERFDRSIDIRDLIAETV